MQFFFFLPTDWLKLLLDSCIISGAKKVDFLQGADGCEWVWVMGEHKNDLSIEEILEREAQEKALKQAEKEALELRYCYDVKNWF